MEEDRRRPRLTRPKDGAQQKWLTALSTRPSHTLGDALESALSAAIAKPFGSRAAHEADGEERSLQQFETGLQLLSVSREVCARREAQDNFRTCQAGSSQV